jgi:hypothetical protein
MLDIVYRGSSCRGWHTVGLVVGSLADVGPQTGLLALDDELGEGVVGAGRAGDSEEDGDDGLHVWCCEEDVMGILMSIRSTQTPSIYTTILMAWWSRHAPRFSILQYYAPQTQACATSFFRHLAHAVVEHVPGG